MQSFWKEEKCEDLALKKRTEGSNEMGGGKSKIVFRHFHDNFFSHATAVFHCNLVYFLEDLMSSLCYVHVSNAFIKFISVLIVYVVVIYTLFEFIESVGPCRTCGHIRFYYKSVVADDTLFS